MVKAAKQGKVPTAHSDTVLSIQSAHRDAKITCSHTPTSKPSGAIRGLVFCSRTLQLAGPAAIGPANLQLLDRSTM